MVMTRSATTAFLEQEQSHKKPRSSSSVSADEITVVRTANGRSTIKDSLRGIERRVFGNTDGDNDPRSSLGARTYPVSGLHPKLKFIEGQFGEDNSHLNLRERLDRIDRYVHLFGTEMRVARKDIYGVHGWIAFLDGLRWSESPPEQGCGIPSFLASVEDYLGLKGDACGKTFAQRMNNINNLSIMMAWARNFLYGVYPDNTNSKEPDSCCGISAFVAALEKDTNTQDDAAGKSINERMHNVIRFLGATDDHYHEMGVPIISINN